MLEANHFRQLAQLALDFNMEAKMANEGEAPPPELESLNRGVSTGLVYLFFSRLLTLCSEAIWLDCLGSTTLPDCPSRTLTQVSSS